MVIPNVRNVFAPFLAPKHLTRRLGASSVVGPTFSFFSQTVKMQKAPKL